MYHESAHVLLVVVPAESVQSVDTQAVTVLPGSEAATPRAIVGFRQANSSRLTIFLGKRVAHSYVSAAICYDSS